MRLGEWCRRPGGGSSIRCCRRLCLGCNEIVAEPGALCAACWPGFSFIAAPHCARCGVPFAEQIGEDAQCGACLRRPPRYRGPAPRWSMTTRAGGLVLPFKHGDRTDMARGCGRWMARAAGDLLAEAELIAPVPLHWRRLFTRRYNQALLLARAVARDGRRRSRTRPAAPRALDRLAGRTARPRSGARTCGAPSSSTRAGPQAVKDKAVLLVDDVLTTGATVEACTLALQRAGARHVDVLTLARVVRAA